MGRFCAVADVKALSTSPLLQGLADEVIESRIVVAEREIAQEFGWEIETDDLIPFDDAKDIPGHLRGIFETVPVKENAWRADYRQSVVHFLDRWSVNPDEHASMSHRGGSASFGPRIPTAVFVLCERWRRPGARVIKLG